MAQKRKSKVKSKSKGKTKAKPRTNKKPIEKLLQTLQQIVINIPNANTTKSKRRKSKKKETKTKQLVQNQSSGSGGYVPLTQYVNKDNRDVDTLRGEIVDSKNKLITQQANQKIFNDNINTIKKELITGNNKLTAFQKNQNTLGDNFYGDIEDLRDELFDLNENKFKTLQKSQKLIIDDIKKAKEFFSSNDKKRDWTDSSNTMAPKKIQQTKIRPKDMTPEEKKEHNKALRQVREERKKQSKQENLLNQINNTIILSDKNENTYIKPIKKKAQDLTLAQKMDMIGSSPTLKLIRSKKLESEMNDEKAGPFEEDQSDFVNFD